MSTPTRSIEIAEAEWRGPIFNPSTVVILDTPPPLPQPQPAPTPTPTPGELAEKAALVSLFHTLGTGVQQANLRNSLPIYTTAGETYCISITRVWEHVNAVVMRVTSNSVTVPRPLTVESVRRMLRGLVTGYTKADAEMWNSERKGGAFHVLRELSDAVFGFASYIASSSRYFAGGVVIGLIVAVVTDSNPNWLAPVGGAVAAMTYSALIAPGVDANEVIVFPAAFDDIEFIKPLIVSDIFEKCELAGGPKHEGQAREYYLCEKGRPMPAGPPGAGHWTLVKGLGDDVSTFFWLTEDMQSATGVQGQFVLVATGENSEVQLMVVADEKKFNDRDNGLMVSNPAMQLANYEVTFDSNGVPISSFSSQALFGLKTKERSAAENGLVEATKIFGRARTDAITRELIQQKTYMELVASWISALYYYVTSAGNVVVRWALGSRTVVEQAAIVEDDHVLNPKEIQGILNNYFGTTVTKMLYGYLEKPQE